MESEPESLLLWQQGCVGNGAGGVQRRGCRPRGGGFSVRDLQEQAETAPALARIDIATAGKVADLDFTLATAAGNNVARWLTALPPNTLDAAGYRRLLQEFARHVGFDYNSTARPSSSAWAPALFSRSHRATRRAMRASRDSPIGPAAADPRR